MIEEINICSIGRRHLTLDIYLNIDRLLILINDVPGPIMQLCGLTYYPLNV